MRNLRTRKRLGVKVNMINDLIAFLFLGAYWGITLIYKQLVPTRFASGAVHIGISFIVPIGWSFYRVTSALIEMKGFIALSVGHNVLRVRNGQLEAVESSSNNEAQ